MKKICSLCIGVIFFIQSNAQLSWMSVDDQYGLLPAHFHVYKSVTPLNGRPFIAYYAEALLKDRHLDFDVEIGDGKRFTPTAYYEKSEHPLLVVNTTFFSFQTNQNLNLVMKGGQLKAYNHPTVKMKNKDSFYYPTKPAFGIRRNRTPSIAWIFTDSTLSYPYAFEKDPIKAKGVTDHPSIKDLQTTASYHRWRMKTAVGGGPVLLQDGAIRITNKEEMQFVTGLKDLHPRTLMGYTNRGTVIIMVIQGRMPGLAEGATLEEEAQIMKDLGCQEAMNLDGGGSSCMLINGKETIHPSDKEGQRAVPAVLVVRKR